MTEHHDYHPEESDGMMSVEEARARILDHVVQLPAEDRPLLEAQGQALAQDVSAPFDVPPMDNSAMDGYALLAADIRGASTERPVRLEVIGHVAAGHPGDWKVRPGVAVRIMTGAPVPLGADTVVPYEDTDEVDQRLGGTPGAMIREIQVRKALSPGTNVRPRGEDVAKGALILQRGAVLGPAHLGVLASLGYDRVEVTRRPVIAILATGDELREPGEPLGPGQIFNSNSTIIAAQVMACGAVPKVLPIARDTVEDLTEKVRAGLSADLFVTSAGVSTGEYDLVKDVLTRQGTMDFWRVRMRPGKPLAFGMLQRDDGTRIPHLGLPGNPVSSMIAFDQFVHPAIMKMMGRPAEDPAIAKAVLEERVSNGDGRRFYARAHVYKRAGKLYARLTGPQGSNILTSMALANGLIVIYEDRQTVEAGEEVDVQLLGHPSSGA